MERTTDSILASFRERTARSEIIDKFEWVEAAQMLNALQGEEAEKLFTLQQEVAKAKLAAVDMGKTVAYAKTLVESSEAYKEYQKQKAKMEQVVEFIRLAKLQARLADESLHS